jgi:hypothetical protein
VKAVPEGYTAAGKTGTAQILDPQTKRYAVNKYTSIFTGFIPADRPRLVISVIIHEPHGANYGGVVAAPVFRNIAAKALPYLGVYPSSNKPSLPLGVRMAGTGQNKASKTTASSDKQGLAGAVDSGAKDSKGVPKGPAIPAVQAKLQPGGRLATPAVAYEAVAKPKTPVDLVMSRVP